MKKVLIIGGGIGGLSIAARLLYKGFEVEIFEKNPTVGGKTNVLKTQDFNFDLTASILMIPKDYTEVFSDCNEDYRNYFSLLPLNPYYRVFYYDGSHYDFSSYSPKLSTTIKNITKDKPYDNYGYFEFLSSNYKKYLLAEKYFLNKPFINKSIFFNAANLSKIPKLKVFTSSYTDCHNFIKNTKLLNYLMFQSMYVGVSPYSSSSIYNLIPAATHFDGLFYIKGGMYAYINALKNLVLKLGGVINTSTIVDEILFKDNKAIGVSINNEAINSDLVVCASDYTYSILNLVKDVNIKNSLMPKKNIEHSCSTFILYLALDKKYPVLNLHNIYINKNFKTNLEAPFKGLLSKDPSLYIYCPSSIDNTVCPPNHEIINVIVRVPNLLYKNISWTKESINNIEEDLINILTNINGLTDIKSHILFKNHLTPIDFENTFNTYAGSAFGISHTLNQSLIFRPQCTNPKVKNLYFVGASIHPGNGVSMVLKSSKICANIIKKPTP